MTIDRAIVALIVLFRGERSISANFRRFPPDAIRQRREVKLHYYYFIYIIIYLYYYYFIYIRYLLR